LEITISGKGGGNGSGFQICSNSIQVAQLWASIQAPEAICVQDSVWFTAYEGVAATHPPPYTFSYTLNGVGQTATTTSTSDSVWMLTPTTPGTYTYELLSVTDANGASVNISCNNTRVVEVQAATVAQFTASPSSGMAPLEVTTQNQSSNATEYEWLIGGFGSAQPPAVQPPTSADEAPVFTFQDTGTYVITLIAYNDLGCSDTTLQTVYVFEKPDEDLQVIIPNVFTPNNDGINDWFGITANVSVPTSVVILNRWGNVVFEKEFVTEAGDFVELWDGASTSSVTTPSSVSTPSSGTVPDGVYFYRVALDGEAWSEEFVGFVTVKK
jgi:gliding motility-associated-like protein